MVRGRDLGALALYGLLTVLATWPVAQHLTTHVPGDPKEPGDQWAYYWDLWWVKTALLDLGQSPLRTSLLHQPDGASLHFHSLCLGPSVLALPITATLGPTVGYNLLVWLSFVLSAFGVYRLVLGLRGADVSREAAFLAGVVYAFAAYRFSRMMGHLDLLSTQWLPFAALFLLRSIREGGSRNAIGLGLLTVLTLLTNWYLGASFVLFVLVVLGARWASAGSAEARLALRRVALPLLGAAVLTSPVWSGMLREGGRGGRLADPLGDSLAHSADLLGFVLPSSAHPLWGREIATLRQHLFGPDENDTENTVFLGFVPLALAALAWRRARSPEARAFAWTLVVFGVLSLGPHLRIAGHEVRVLGHPLPMPYLALYHLPYGTLAHAPARFVLVAGLGLAVLAGLGAQRLMTAPGRPRWLLGALVALALFETAAVPYPLAEVRHPAAYGRLSAAAGAAPGVLLEVPIPDWPAQLPQRMLYQTRHGRPVFGGYLSRSLPPHPFHAVPGFRELKSLTLDRPDIDGIGRDALPQVARVALRAYGTTDVILLKDDFRLLPGLESLASSARAVLVALLGAPSYEDEEGALFPVPEGTARAFVCPERGFLPLERHAARPTRAVGSRARIGLWAPEPGPYEVKLTGYAVGTDRLVELRFAEGPARTAAFSASLPTTARYAGQARRGWQWIELACWDAGESADEPCLVVTELALSPSPSG